MTTERLHLRDSLLLEFDALVLRLARFDGRPSIVLDRTAFYAEAGGQLGDRGALFLDGKSIAVVDTQRDDGSGEIHHLLDADVALDVALDETSRPAVRGQVERARRLDMMSQHTGQHMLSCALLDVAGGATVSSRLGAQTSTIDLDLPLLSDERIAAAEDVVNAIVLEDRAVEVLFPTAEELARLSLRRTPKVDKDIRVIHIPGYDASPCGGTHCRSTGQVGPVRILKTERYKGMTRVTFVAGQRSIDDHRVREAALREVALTLKCGALDVPASVARLRTELRSTQSQLGAARAELMRHLSSSLLAAHAPDPAGTTRIVVTRPEGDLESLRALAGALAVRPDVVALVAARDAVSGDWLVVAERGASASFDAGAWLKQQAAAHGGRGGGRAEHAEGRLPSSVDFSAL